MLHMMLHPLLNLLRSVFIAARLELSTYGHHHSPSPTKMQARGHDAFDDGRALSPRDLLEDGHGD